MPWAPVQARADTSGRQVVDITVRGGYSPASIQVVAGLPLRLRFRRDDDDDCSERVVFSTSRVDCRLATSGLTTVDLPAQPPGVIRFTCGMGRYRGRIEVLDGTRPPIGFRLRQLMARLAQFCRPHPQERDAGEPSDGEGIPDDRSGQVR